MFGYIGNIHASEMLKTQNYCSNIISESDALNWMMWTCNSFNGHSNQMRCKFFACY
jgi:hypothetical protein